MFNYKRYTVSLLLFLVKSQKSEVRDQKFVRYYLQMFL